MPSPLHTVLPEDHAAVVDRLAATFANADRELVLVGGIVRDLLIGEDLPADLDFATNAVPEETVELGTQAGAESVYLVGVQFGTVGLVFAPTNPGGSPIQVEITTYRAENYPHDTRKPEVEFGETLLDDLSRRDFTINAIASDAVTGELHDPFDGQADIARGLIRAVGDPDERFREDPLRILRAARFVSQLGFAIDAETASAMERQAESLARISRERILAELTRLLTGRWASHGLTTLRETGLLAQTMPELEELAFDTSVDAAVHREKDLWEHTIRVVDRADADPVVRWAALLHDAAKPRRRSIDRTGEIHFFGHEREGAVMARTVLGNLKAGKHLVESVCRVVELHGRPETYEDSWTDSAVRRLMLDADSDIDALLALAAADVTSARTERQLAAEQRIDRLRDRIHRIREQSDLVAFDSPLDGNELMAMFDRPPGRWIADIKNHLRELVIDGELEPGDRETAARIAHEMMEQADQ